MLGIDAAWTATHPSGVALAVETAGGWRLVAAEASYDHFLARAAGRTSADRPSGGSPDIAALLDAATRLAGVAPALIAVDMPLAHHPITARRAADNQITRAYGGRKCGTHSPSATRPGPISDALTHACAAAGYPLRTTTVAAPGLIEVYPHPALIEWTDAAKRLPYKRGNTTKYLPGTPRVERLARLAQVWRGIVAALDARIAGTAALLGAPEPSKAAEDRLDAVICCAVAVDALAGRARAFGDDDAAIWVPVS